MVDVPRQHPSLVRCGARPYELQASEAGVTPPDWPVALTTTLGDGAPLERRARRVDGQGRTTGVVYHQPSTGVRVTIAT